MQCNDVIHARTCLKGSGGEAGSLLVTRSTPFFPISLDESLPAEQAEKDSIIFRDHN